ncbi:hypothetical protein ACFLZ9_00050 [Patescibacteria group bacterium]
MNLVILDNNTSPWTLCLRRLANGESSTTTPPCFHFLPAGRQALKLPSPN